MPSVAITETVNVPAINTVYAYTFDACVTIKLSPAVLVMKNVYDVGVMPVGVAVIVNELA